MTAPKSDPIKTINQFKVLNTIRIAGKISRVELARLTGQSRATVTNITAQLKNENLIYEKSVEERSVRGRHRVLLAINPEAAFVIGVKVSAFKIGCALTNILGELKSATIIPVRTNERSVEFIADIIEEGIRHCISDARLSADQISGIGLGIPGFIESRKGLCHWSPLHKPGDVQLHNLIEKRFKIRTFVENDANTVALAHLWTGQGKGVDNFIVVTIEDGVGIGIVVDGEIYRGTRGLAGEFGHMVLNPDGPACRCGKKGCIEAYASNFGILGMAQKLCTDGTWSCDNPEHLSYEIVLEAAQNGHPAIEAIFHRAGKYLGIGLAGLIQIFNPSKLIITGNGIRAGDLLFSPMKEALRRNTNEMIYNFTELIIHDWVDHDWSLGAACTVLQEIYKSPMDRADDAAFMLEVMKEREQLNREALQGNSSGETMTS